jgi:hypothetical protein
MMRSLKTILFGLGALLLVALIYYVGTGPIL